MATKPSTTTDWATDGGALKLDPTSNQQTRGWDTSDGTTAGVPDKPTLQHQNGWQNLVHQWILYLEEVTDNSVVPLGGIIGVSSDLTGAFDSATGVVTDGFILCDGAAIPGGNAVSGTTPNLTDSRFLMGSSTAGTSGGNASNQINLQHNHDISHNHQVLGWNRFSSIRSALYTVSFSSSASNAELTGIDANKNIYTQGAESGGTGANAKTNTALSDAFYKLYSSGALDAPSGSLGTAASDSQLSTTQSILPQYYTVKYFMRVN